MVLGALGDKESPYYPRCVGFLFAFMDARSGEGGDCMQQLCIALQSPEPKMRWNAAAALAVAFKFGAIAEAALALLVGALDEDKIAKVKIRATEAFLNLTARAQLGDLFQRLFVLVLQQLLIPSHFTNLALAMHRKYNAAFRGNLVKLFFTMVKWTTARDFSAFEEILIANVETVFELFAAEEDAPWQSITRLYEAKFNSIPSKTLERFQDRAFPV
jgi:hypothetical protein